MKTTTRGGRVLLVWWVLAAGCSFEPTNDGRRDEADSDGSGGFGDDGSAPGPTPGSTSSVSILWMIPTDPDVTSADPTDENDTAFRSTPIQLPYDLSTHRLAKPRAFSVQVLAQAAQAQHALVELFFGRETPPDPADHGNLAEEVLLEAGVARTVTLAEADLPTQAATVFSRVSLLANAAGPADLAELQTTAEPDEDWYRADVSGRVSIQLLGLPANYDLEVFDAVPFDKNGSLVMLGGSRNGGVADETFTLGAGAHNGRILVRVFSPDGASSASPYRLKVY